MKMRRNFKILSVIFLGATLFLGCTGLNDMQSKTDLMAATTQSMSNDSGVLKDTSLAMYANIRKGTCFDNRKKAREAVENSKNLSDKLGYAKVYFYAFEFQLWRDEGLDDQAKLAELKDYAVEEFFQFLTKHWKTETFWTNPLPLSSNTLDLYAYGAAIHEIDPDQLAQAQKKGFKAISLLSIVEEGLRAEHKDPGQDPDKQVWWKYYDGLFKRNAIELMKRRITFMPLLAYAFLNHVETESSLGLILDSVFNVSWTVDPESETTNTLDFVGLIIRRALMTRHFLNEIGIDATPDDSLRANLNIKKTYRNMHVEYDRSNLDQAYLFRETQMARFQKWTNLLYAPRADFIKVDPASYVIIDR